MFKTIKTKIIFITVIMLIIISVIASVLTFSRFLVNKKQKLDICDLQITNFSEQINISVQRLQDNAKALSLDGAIFYFGKSSQKDIDLLVRENFKNNNLKAIGGGLWFEHYKINPRQKKVYSYAYRNSENQVVIEKFFDNPINDYTKENWYKEIKKNALEIKSTPWVTPYVDNMGSKALITTIGAGIFDGNKFVGMATVDLNLSAIVKEVQEFCPTENSFILLADIDKNFVIVDTEKNISRDYVGVSLMEIPWYTSDLKNRDTFVYKNVKYVSFVKKIAGNLIMITNVPERELYSSVFHRLVINFLYLIFVCTSIALIMYRILKYNIYKPIEYLRNLAAEIGSGDFDKEIKIEEPEEFASLANSFNKMTENVKKYITNLHQVTAEKQKIDSELNIAKSIQYSILPSIFPPYPNHKDFDIYANMNMAKDVGGDFYDFFFIDPDHFVFLVADVSGKGIPAALFMMTTKTMIKNVAKTNMKPEDLISKINKNVCKGNEQGFFVTLFLCIIELSTGKLICMNAGHNPPLLKRADGEYAYFKTESNLVLGVMDSVKYKVHVSQLNKGDSLLLYTDGVTEANNSDEELYGEERLLEVMNSPQNVKASVKDIIENIKQDVKDFAQGAEQSDDMTMLMFKYNGAEEKVESVEMVEKRILLPAKIEYLKQVLKWVEALCRSANVPNEKIMKLNLVIEEIFVNISLYAYPPKDGDVEVACEIDDNKITLKFKDYGVEYNPLIKQDPDITLAAEDRPIGGLGIFMVKNIADAMDYEYKDGHNILSVEMKY